MKKLKINQIIYFIVALFILVGCADNTNEESTTDSSENSSVIKSTEEKPTETDESKTTSELEESGTDDANDVSSEVPANDDTDNTTSENSDSAVEVKEDNEALSPYSNEQIEYARVWLQLGPNQDIDGLYAQHLPAGTPLDPDDETSVAYPEDVIQLTGGRLVDGIVTYSGNGDGTINVYNVPSRWYGGVAPPENLDKDKIQDQMNDIIENTKLVYVDPGDNEEIIKLIEVLNIH
ncbi:hypothetical protein [Oceanobacillus chungangensis]|uniref:Lipoprotein n=1 Tax=Oceanobacillus chungangensis TaxID=1229152 RepID=A0A3D8PN62_9BACI|nr:hypothetical protein [Oceanobacillus chungangensis]RDW16678.1 hypothetical protein CWR45_13685 [Oceanobacillus chungangensis]